MHWPGRQEKARELLNFNFLFGQRGKLQVTMQSSSAEVTMMESQNRKRAPAWTERESGPSQKEELLEGDPEAEDNSEIRDVCSQELFSTPEEASQSQLSELGEARTGEEESGTTLGAQPPSLLSPAEWLHRIRKQPRRTKEYFLRDVMMRSAAKKQELKEWWDSKKRDRKENAACQNKAMEWLLKVMERQADVLQALLALQTEQLRTHPPLQPLLQKTLSPCTPQTLPTHSYNLLAPVCTRCIPLLPRHSPALRTPSTHCTQHLSLCSLALLKNSTHCNCIPKDKVA
ncbi:hypothetical protein UY3_06952 [Chelonia mydas]|uniref:Uncharacterized protein n=1 Tax=Chelonia mydas TaxID=8469 RepID=M7BD77_CHEMY|nr:hypothetical protein UY3_06952 [Chelonia mydas]